MIIEIQGKKLVFGLTWRTLLGAGAPTVLASKAAREIGAKTIWHEASALYMGALDGSDAEYVGKDKLYAAAPALARVSELGSNAFFVFHVQDGGVHIGYLVIGIVRNRPRTNFDQVVQDEQAVTDLAREFLRVCPGEFVMAGNLPVPFDEFTKSDKFSSVVSMTLEDIASIADQHAAMGKRGLGVDVKKIVATTVIGGLVVTAGWQAWLKWQAHEAALAPPPVQETPAMRYGKQLAQAGQAPAIALADMGPFDEWMHRVVSSWFTIGGWSLSKVACDAAAGGFDCALTYGRDISIATNQTFVAAAPAEFKEILFDPERKKLTASTFLSVPKAERLGDVLAALPTVKEANVVYGSQLQSLTPVAQQEGPLAFGGFPDRNLSVGVPHVVRHADWSFVGPLRNLALLSSAPRYVTVKSATVDVDLNAKPDKNTSKFKLNITGGVYARD